MVILGLLEVFQGLSKVPLAFHMSLDTHQRSLDTYQRSLDTNKRSLDTDERSLEAFQR